MKPYTKQDIENIYGDLMRSAYKNYVKCKLERALKDLEAAAEWAYNFNHIYTDHEAELLLMQIGEKAIEPVQVDSPMADHCVLIDSFLLDNRGLSQQYLRAMMANGMHILVIYTNTVGHIGKDTLAEIKAYDKAEIISYPRSIDRIDEARQVVNAIHNYRPSRIFLHVSPVDTVALMACHAVKNAKIYQINLTDHAYWIGAEFIDYTLEFRPYGMTVSQEKRGLKPEQCLALPYYPITPMAAVFEGVPEMPKDAIKVFTGGTLYKILGKDDIFFRIMECILDISPKVYILVAGFYPDKRFDEKVSKIKGVERVLQIGVRKDIDAVFDHCDIYLGTYPMAGGLMSQYAAKHAKPIIAYHDEGDLMNVVEEFVSYNNHDFCSFDNLDAMTAYAEKLICDENYRIAQGKLLQDGMMNEECFNKKFQETITSHHFSFTWHKDQIDYDAFFERYLDLENNNGFRATRLLVTNLKMSAFTKVKKYRANIAESLYNVIINVPPGHLFRWLFYRIIQHLRL